MKEPKTINKKKFFKALDGGEMNALDLAIKMNEINVSPNRHFHFNLWRLIDEGYIELTNDLKVRKVKK